MPSPLSRTGAGGPGSLEAALLVALAARCAGRTVGEGCLRQALEALGIPPPDPWFLQALCRLAESVPAPASGPEPGARVDREAAAPDRVQAPEVGPREPGEPASTVPLAEGVLAPEETSGQVPVGQVPVGEEPRGAEPCGEEPTWGLYLHALAPADGLAELRCAGVDGRPVELVRAGEWVAVVHRCPGPYAGERREQLVQWVRQHHEVVEQAARLAGDVIPVAFNTVVRRAGQEPVKTLSQWMEDHGAQLRAVWRRVAGCQEFGVQLLREPIAAQEALVAEQEELGQLHRQAGASGPGTAYLLEQELQQKLRQAAQEQAASQARRLMEQLQAWCRELRQEPLRPVEEGLEMVAHFSCLVPRPSGRAFVDALQAMELLPGYCLRTSGPWPPYSFVALGEPGEDEGR